MLKIEQDMLSSAPARTFDKQEKHNSCSNKMFISSLCKKYLSFGCRFSMDLGHNLNLRENYEKLVRTKCRHHFIYE